MSTRTGHPEHRAPHARAIRNFDSGAAHAAPRHRQSGEWKLIAETPRYTLHEHTETHETRTSWTTHEGFRAVDL